MAEHSTNQTSAAPRITVVVVTPEQTVLEQETNFVALPLYDGELGVAPGHAPMIGRLGYGELRIGHEPEAQRMYVDGGFVQVADNVVSILTNRALPAATLNRGSLQEALDDVLKQKAAGEEQLARRDRALSQTRAQLRVASRSA